MTVIQNTPNSLEDLEIHVKLKFPALWTSMMFCYVYGDYFGLYKPGSLQRMLDGQMGPLGPTTQGVLLGTSLLMAVPSLMVVLSLVLVPRLNRGLNLILGRSIASSCSSPCPARGISASPWRSSK